VLTTQKQQAIAPLRVSYRRDIMCYLQPLPIAWMAYRNYSLIGFTAGSAALVLTRYCSKIRRWSRRTTEQRCGKMDSSAHRNRTRIRSEHLRSYLQQCENILQATAGLCRAIPVACCR